MGFEAKIQQKINAYRQTHPKVKMSDEQIVSILVKNGEIVLTEDQKRSLFANNSKHNDNIGLKLEKTAKKPNPEKTIYLQSGRKVVYSKLSNGKTVMKYYGADGNRINPDYFKKVEGQISISADGNSYTVTKNGKKQTLKAKNPTQGAIDQNIAKLKNQEKALNKAKKEQGWIGKGWDWFKNKTGIGDGSDKAQQQINAERKLLKQVKTGKISKKDFKETTGLDYTKENLAKFQKGELSQAETKINGYKEGQDMATDMVGDMVSGIAAVGIYTAAIAATPFTGGASLLVGFGLATASGAAIKVGIKALDTVGTDKKYTLKDLKHDAATGAFSGGLAPLTAGLGGAVGKTVATKWGIQAVKTVGKEVAEEAAKGGVKSTLKAALANPAGYEYVGGTFVKRTTSMAAEMATDGALGGAIDGGFRAGLDSDWDAETMLDGAVEGGIGGALFAPAIGGGMKALGKGAQKAFGKDNVKIDANGNKVADEVPSKIESETPRVEKDIDTEPASFKKSITHEEQDASGNKNIKPETPIQIQQRLIKELKTAKSREDFSRITQEMKNLPKTEEYQAVRQRLGGEYFQRYNEWKANLPESTRAIKNMADDVPSKEIKLKENSSLTPEETKSNLLELGFTPEEIANIDCENKGVQTYINVARTMIFELKMEFPGVNLKDPQARKGLIEEALDVDEEFLNTALFKYLNKENVNTLKQYITDLNDFEDYKNLFSNLEYCEYLDLLIEKIPLISKLYNNKLSIEDFQNYSFGYDYRLQNLDENSATKISEYNKLLPEEYQFRLFDIDRLTEENLSLEIVQSYAKECERFKEIGLYEYSDSHSTIAEQTMQMKKIADMLEQYKLNFKYKEGGKEYSLGNSTLIDIANSNNIKETVEFLNSLTPEGRALGVGYLKAPTTIPKESFVSFLNKLSKSENTSFDRKDEIVKMLYSEDMKNHVDFTDYIIELTENTSVLKDYDWEEYCLVANQDYKGAKNLLNELKIYFNDNKQFDNYINHDFRYICQNKDIDYTRAVANVKEMGNRNLSVVTLNSVIRSSNKEAVDIAELLDKTGFTNSSSLVRDLLSDKDISLAKINEKLDIVKTEIRKKYPDLKDIDDNLLLQYINRYNYNNEYYLLHAIKDDCKTIDDINAIYSNDTTGISYLRSINGTNKQLFKMLMNDNDIPKNDIIRILYATTEANVTFAEKLCADKEFPKDKIAVIFSDRNKDNLAFAEKLYTDKDFPKDKIADIVEATNKDNLALAEKLCANKEIPLEHLSKILRSTNQLNADIVIDFCKTYNNYGFSADRIIDFVPHLKDINFENMQTLRTKISENAYQKMSASDFVILTNNMELLGKTSVESLLKSEKYNLINLLLSNKNLICNEKLHNIKEAIAIFPTNEAEYAERMKELSDSLNISFDKLTPEKQAKFDSSIGSLSNGIKEMNLADLSEINLKYSQKEFINNINELLKDLPTEEQIKLQNKFGFRIIDNKLTGYPKTVKDINSVDFENKELLNKINEKVDSFLNNNALTVKDNPQLNSLLNDLLHNCPEILNQIDGTVEFAKTVKRLQTIVNREEFKTLSDSDKKIIELAILVENTDKSINTSKDVAFDAFFIGQKYGLSDNDAKKLYYIVEAGSSVETFMQTTKDTTVRKYRTSQITGQDRQDKFDMMALNLKEDNRLKMAQMLYSSKYPEGFTRNFDKALENRVNEIKSQDFILPQTPSETYQNYATATEISRGNNKYNVNVVNAKDIPNMYAFVHTPEAGYATGGTRAANFSNFEAFATLNDDKVICTSYVSADKAGLVKEFHKGFIFEVQNDKQYVAYGRDIYSLGKNIQDIVVEYYRDKGFKAGQNKGDKYDHRTLMSNIMKQMLFGKDYYQISKDVVGKIAEVKAKYLSKLYTLKTERESIIKNTFGTDNITNEQYRELKSNTTFVNIEKQMKALRNQELAEIENIPEYKELKDMDNKYIARLDNVKVMLGNKPMTLDNIRIIDTELADVYKAFLDKDGANKVEHDNSASLLRSSWHNEALVSNPKITGIFTDNIENIPEEYLKKAQEENLPIVIFDVSK